MAPRALIEAMELKGAEFHSDPSRMVSLSLAFAAEACSENLALPFCMTVESESYGGEVEELLDAEAPALYEYPLKDIGDLGPLEAAYSPGGGRLGKVVEAIRMLSQSARGEIPVIADVCASFSLAATLVESDALFRSLLKAPDKSCYLLDLVCENTALFISALADAGADAVLISEQGAGVLGPDLFERFSLPYINNLCEEACASGLGAIVHLCGDLAPFYGVLKGALGADVLSVDFSTHLGELKEALGGELRIMGNIDGRLFEAPPGPELREAVEGALSAGVDILSPSCSLGSAAATESLKAVRDALLVLGK